MRTKDADVLIKKFGPGTPGPTIEDLLKDDSLMKIFGITKAGLANALHTDPEQLLDSLIPNMEEFYGMAKDDVADLQELGRGSGVASAVPHTSKRLRKDQKRTQRTRINSASYRKQEAILDRALEHVQSVPYAVSLRWLFYRLYQEGIYKTKDDYKFKFTPLLSRARHTFFKGWRPDTLSDETREAVSRTGGYMDAAAALRGLGPRLRNAALVDIDHFYRQENYIELWFEARAMTGQFEHYTKDVDLVPMGGTASIPFKWNLAKRLETMAERYGKPIKILYFGDEDLAGHTIQETVESDVRGWTQAAFELIWCGLTEEQVRQYKVPENVEKKGYQWEALDDTAAEQIITEAVEKYIDVDLIDETENEEEEVADKCGEAIEKVLEGLR
jgi:hypothetical protein